MTEPLAATRTVVVERDMPFPPDKVWRALTQPHLIAEWLMKNDFEPLVGRQFTLSGDWGSVACQVLTVEPHRTLSYTWDHAHEEAAYDVRSIVTFTLSPTPTGTHLRMEQSGFRPEQKHAFGGAQYGWTQHLENLEKAAARLGEP
jgi:uncharacterized protein YndB with AHSA1/START domain